MIKRLVLCLVCVMFVGCRSAAPDAAAPTAVSTTTNVPLPSATAVAAADLTDSALPLPSPTPATPSFAGTIAAPEFPTGLDWLNTERPLTLGELRGKMVLLDFWTYGCVNCMHVIPELKRLEEKYADELVVIGVHSAKFDTEKETDNIRQIILRYELTHPVLNDRNFEVWNLYGAQAWPTFVMIDPLGNVLGFHSGEGVYSLFDRALAGMEAEFDQRGLIDRTPLDFSLERDGLAEQPLLFPGKVLADAANGRLFIADSNHNRIVITNLDGVVLEVVGNGRSDLQDGDYETASFFRPQGMTLADANTLYVADTENHAIRRVDLSAKLVETVAGNGRHGAYERYTGAGPEVALNTPWDVLMVDGIVYIAMAGQHQLWQYDPASGIVSAFAGSGREELRDGSLTEGGLNQPSGLASNGRLLYIADSEASAIRTASLADSQTGLQTIVGTGLFDFGDVDGTGDAVRLQHPLAVAYAAGLLYVADTYNHKIKRIDPTTGESRTLLGTGEDGWRDGTQQLFDEPGGLSVAGNLLYIADTNNHVIRIANLETGEVATLVLVDSDGLLTRQPPDAPYTGKVIALEPQAVAAGAGTVTLHLALPPGYKLNDLAPFSVEWSGQGVALVAEDMVLTAVAPGFPITIPATFAPDASSLQADMVVYYCEEVATSLCLIERARLLLPLTVVDGGGNTAVFDYTVPAPPSLDD